MRSKSRRFLCLSALVAGLSFGGVQDAAAAVLDWNAVGVAWTANWDAVTPNTVTQTFTNVQGTGVDITITITRPVATDISEVSKPNDSSNGAFIVRGGALQIQAQFGADNSNLDGGAVSRATDYVTVNISFSQPVLNASFGLWDIDYAGGGGDSGYQDILRNFSVTGGGGSAPTLTAASGSPTVSVTPTELRGVVPVPDNTTNADVNVTYGGGTVTSFTFDYAPGDGSGNTAGPGGSALPNFADSELPGTQRIGLSNIFFQTIPEVFTGRGALFACFAAVLAPLFGRRRRQLVEA